MQPGWAVDAAGVAGAGSSAARAALLHELRAGAPRDDVATLSGLRRLRAERVVAARRELCDDEAWSASALRQFRLRHGLHEFVRAVLPFSCDEGPRALFIDLVSCDESWAPDDDTVEALAAVAPHVCNAYGAAFVEPDRRRRELLSMLTDTQRLIAPMLADGHSESAIAESLRRSRHTIHDHAKRIYKTWGISSRFELRELWLGAGNHRPADGR